MLTYKFSADDVAEVRFAISPMGEMGLSLRVLRAPRRFPARREIVREMASGLRPRDLETLVSLVDADLRTPDFLNPCPVAPVAAFENELQDFKKLSYEHYLRDLRAASPWRASGRLPLESPDHQRLVGEALESYWDTGFARVWPRVREVLESDVTFRALTTARSGLASTLRGLSSHIDYSRNSLRLAVRDPRSCEIETQGGCTTLVPTLFTTRVSAPINLTGAPMLLYPSRGTGALRGRPTSDHRTALSELIGPAKSELLRVLAEPSSTTDLAGRLGVTPSAVSQQLRVLAHSGLLTRSRDGRRVLYVRSELGELLLDWSR